MRQDDGVSIASRWTCRIFNDIREWYDTVFLRVGRSTWYMKIVSPLSATIDVSYW